MKAVVAPTASVLIRSRLCILFSFFIVIMI
jgi:hypothetical protein